MRDRTLKLLLVDPDPIFRTGLRVALNQIADLQVTGEVETISTALRILASGKSAVSTASDGMLAVDTADFRTE